MCYIQSGILEAILKYTIYIHQIPILKIGYKQVYYCIYKTNKMKTWEFNYNFIIT